MNEKPVAYNESAIRGSSMQNRSINTVQGRAFTATVSGRKVLGGSSFVSELKRRLLGVCLFAPHSPASLLRAVPRKKEPLDPGRSSHKKARPLRSIRSREIKFSFTTVYFQTRHVHAESTGKMDSLPSRSDVAS